MSGAVPDALAAAEQAVSFLGELDFPVRRIAIDSRRVRPGDTFLAYPGEAQDGRRYIGQAIANGAGSVLWEARDFRWDPQWRVPNRGVAGLRSRAGWLASHLAGHPSSRLWMVGVTGTNGKTSCSQWLAQSFGVRGRKAGVVGTLGAGFPGALQAFGATTPDPVALQDLFVALGRDGAQAVAMEVSSHALAQERVNGVFFDVAVLTNLSRDHLDYHGTMDAYARAKARLFAWPGLKHAVVNLDEPFGLAVARELRGSSVALLGYGLGPNARRRALGLRMPLVKGERLRLDESGIRMTVRADGARVRLRSPMIGRFNAANLLAVIATLLASGVTLDDAATALGRIAPVPGRMERLTAPNGPLVVIDYAHTPDALEKVLGALRDVIAGERREGARLICVFGCGGERDRGKRPLMGAVATRLADKVVVTSDNPRSEDPRAIIDEIVSGAGANYRIVEDRASAIFEAIRGARAGDVVLIAGKGHEHYQEIAGRRLPFSDADVAQRVLDGRLQGTEA
ncbi:MAG: UDP-N-acetylmuramoyl-L-alanyl-D-glutamate--2,6-diaminopimelate ligase [Pseudomonadota bacterium]